MFVYVSLIQYKVEILNLLEIGLVFRLPQFVYTKKKSYPFVDGASTAARSRGKL